MRFSVASEPAPGRPNEDCVIVGPHWVVVLDGATPPAHLDSGCIQDLLRLVRHLAGSLTRTLLTVPDVPLSDAVADAISLTCKEHEATCDLTNPDSPSSTVTVMRQREGHLDYLALADSPLILDTADQVVVITDDKITHLTDYSYAGVSAARNTPEGFYVASTVPDAACHAVQGSIDVNEIRRAALLTDGASRLVDYFRLIAWNELLDLLENEGPRELLARTRTVEREGTEPAEGRRGKLHDDATAVFIALS